MFLCWPLIIFKLGMKGVDITKFFLSVLLIALFLMSGCTMVTNEDFNQRMDSLESKIDSLCLFQAEIDNLSKKISDISFKINSLSNTNTASLDSSNILFELYEIKQKMNTMSKELTGEISVEVDLEDLEKKIDSLMTKQNQILLVLSDASSTDQIYIPETIDNSLGLLSLEQKIDYIIKGQTEIEDKLNYIDSLTNQLKFINSFFENANNSKDYDALFSDLGEIKTLLNETKNNEEQINEINQKLDSIMNGTVHKYFMEEELSNIKDNFLEAGLVSREEINEIYSKIQNLQNLLLSISGDPTKQIESEFGSDIVTMDIFLAEISNLKSTIGEKAYKSLDLNSNLVYKVQSGDSLWSIAEKFNTTVDKIKSANTQLTSNNIFRGDQITIPVSVNSLLSSNKIQSHLGISEDFNSLINSIESTFGSYDKGYANPGIDISVDDNTIIKSLLPGMVILSEYLNDDYGETIIIETNNELRIVYSKLKTRFLKDGDYVSSGDQIGITEEGKSNLHFEIWKNETPVNPADVLFENLGYYDATMYTEWDDGKNPTSPSFKMGASGNYVKGYRTISADPDYLPIGSIIYVPFFANSPNNGFFVIEDTGSAVIGKRIDIYTHDFDIAKNFKEELIVYLVNKP